MKKLLVLTAVAMLVLGTTGCRCFDWCRRGEMCGYGGGCGPCGDTMAPACAPSCAPACGPCGAGAPGPECYSPAPMQ
jgi:hypothetical protein